MSEVYLNGQYMPISEARISPLDRGFLFADSVYEVIPAYGDALFRFREHIARLTRSLGEVAIRNPHSDEEWRAICEELLRRNSGGNRAVYIQVSRGATDRRDHGFPSSQVQPTTFAMVSQIASPPPSDVPSDVSGYRITTADDSRWSRCDIKSTSLLANILLKQEAAARGGGEVLLIRNGCVTEGSTSNVFVVEARIVSTPPRDNRILGGVTRDLVIELCRHAGIEVREREIPVDELRTADEIWLTSSTREVVPVVAIDDQPVGDGAPGHLWHEVAALFAEYKRTLRKAEAFA